MTKLLFVCLGNICRSPSAEAIMNKFALEKGLLDKVFCDSAGTSGYHNGYPADERSVAALEQRGYKCFSKSRAVDPLNDFDEFDYILAMDSSNLDNLLKLAETYKKDRKNIFLMSEFRIKRPELEVPDPYSGGEQGFFKVIDILEDSCQGLLNKISK